VDISKFLWHFCRCFVIILYLDRTLNQNSAYRFRLFIRNIATGFKYLWCILPNGVPLRSLMAGVLWLWEGSEIVSHDWRSVERMFRMRSFVSMFIKIGRLVKTLICAQKTRRPQKLNLILHGEVVCINLDGDLNALFHRIFFIRSI